MDLTQRHARTHRAFGRGWTMVSFVLAALLGAACQSGGRAADVGSVAASPTLPARLANGSTSDPLEPNAPEPIVPIEATPATTVVAPPAPPAGELTPPDASTSGAADGGAADGGAAASGPTTPDQTRRSGVEPVLRRVPVADGVPYDLGDRHSDYPATDIFAACGSLAIAPVDGVVIEARTLDHWSAGVDNPATRGGLSVTIVGVDGVRYYLSHFSAIMPGIAPGVDVSAGDALATVGQTGRAGACHIHFGLSPPCVAKEWRVRRGVVDPTPYLRAWATGGAADPRDEVTAWLDANPNGCDDAMAEPTAAQS